MLGVLSSFFCAVGYTGVYNDLAVTVAGFGPDVPCLFVVGSLQVLVTPQCYAVRVKS